MRIATYGWPLLEVDGCLVFRIRNPAELGRVRVGAYQWAERHGWHIQCLQVPGILFVVRYPDGSGTVTVSTREDVCQVDQVETKCKGWRLYVPTARRSGRKRLLTLQTAPRWGRPLQPSSGQPSPSRGSTASR